jgi:hypothetical protein
MKIHDTDPNEISNSYSSPNLRISKQSTSNEKKIKLRNLNQNIEKMDHASSPGQSIGEKPMDRNSSKKELR